MTRRRRDRLTGALRTFGLTDRFDLASLLASDALPTQGAIARRITAFPDALPDGITPGYLAGFIRAELAESGSVRASGLQSVQLTPASITALEAIPVGRPAAGKYHSLIFRILTGLFAGRLVDPTKEAKQFSGRKRIDIRYRNVDETGFFAELTRHHIKAPYIIIECKNYASDPDNPEFDQLSGRLNERVGMFGLMIVRNVVDRARMDAHRLDRRVKQEWILVLDDDDVVAMVEAHLRGDANAIDRRLREKLEPLLFN